MISFKYPTTPEKYCPHQHLDHSIDLIVTMTMTMTIFYSTIDIQIEILIYNSLENQIINWSGDYY